MASYDDTATVSGSVVSIENGADDVPTKSLIVTIPPTLSGVSSVTETQTGKNLLDTANAETKTNNSVSITCDGNGKYTATGTATGGSANVTFTLKTPCTIKSGMYLHLMNSGAIGSVAITLQKQDNTTIYAPALSPANRIADLSSYAGETVYSIRFYVVNGASFEMILTPMICFSSTASTFEPYQTPTTYTASLGRTIYGGSADIANGEGQEKYKIFTASDVTSLYWNGKKAQQVDTNHRATFRIALPSGYITVNNSLCNELSYTINIASGSGEYEGYQLIATAGIYFCIDLADIGMENATSDTPDVDFINAIHNYGDNLKFVVELATPTDFTFTGQEIPTRLGYNAFWSEQGNTELTYYKDGYGYTSVTVNKTGKNLFDISKVATTGTTAGISWSVSGNEITISGTATSSGWKSIVQFTLPKKGTYHFHMKTTGNVGYFLRGYTQLVGTDVTEVCNDTSQVYRIAIASTTAGQTYEGTISEIQIEVGDAYTSYEPYEAVSKTAYLHKVIYGGEVDVIKGTAKPKNLLDDNKRVFTAHNIIFGRDSGGRDDFCLKLKAGTYTFSVTTADGTYTNLYLKNSDTKESISGFPAYATSSKSFTLTEDTNCAVFVYKSDYTSVSDITSAQIEKGSSASEYVPHFEPFSFPPISMSTDEGENTLFANEGASAITYRKEI